MKDTGAGRKIAVLGGSAEARAVVARLGARASLWLPETPLRGRDADPAGTGRDPGALGVWLGTAQAVIVAPHPCDMDLAGRVVAMARVRGLETLVLRRPGWRATRRDRWVRLATPRAARAAVAPGERLLVTLGRGGLAELRGLDHARLFIRQLSRHDAPCPLRAGRYIHGAPPFTVAQEVALMRRLRLTGVLTRDAGGEGGWPKVAAARKLGLTVYMIDRPAAPPGPLVTHAAAALDWLEERAWLNA